MAQRLAVRIYPFVLAGVLGVLIGILAIKGL